MFANRSNQPGTPDQPKLPPSKAAADKAQAVNLAQNFQENQALRASLLTEEAQDFERLTVSRDEVTEGRIFGLNAVERMILAIILFIAVLVIGGALLLGTGTIVLH